MKTDTSRTYSENHYPQELTEEVAIEILRDSVTKNYDWYVSNFRKWSEAQYSYFATAGRELSDAEKEEQALIYKIQLNGVQDIYHRISDPVIRDRVILQMKESIEDGVKLGVNTHKRRQHLLEIQEFFKNLPQRTRDTNSTTSTETDTHVKASMASPNNIVIPAAVPKPLHELYENIYHKLTDVIGHGISTTDINIMTTSFKDNLLHLTKNGPSKMMAFVNPVTVAISSIFLIPFMAGEYINSLILFTELASIEEREAKFMALLVYGMAHLFADAFFMPRMILGLRNGENLNTHIPLIKSASFVFLFFAASLGAASYSSKTVTSLGGQTEIIALEDVLSMGGENIALSELAFADEPNGESKLQVHFKNIEVWKSRSRFFTYIYMLLYGVIALIGSAYLWAIIMICIKVFYARYKVDKAEKNLTLSNTALRESVSRLDQMKLLFAEIYALEEIYAYRQYIYGIRNLN